MATETEWIRRWRPSLAACPWLSVDVDGKNLLIKMKFSVKAYEVLITDLTSFWHESLDEYALKKRILKLNPSIEAPITKILDQIKLNIEKPAKGTKLAVSFKHFPDDGGQKLTLRIASHLAGMPFEWNFHADPADSAMARDHLTLPLLAMVSELLRQRQELTAVLAMKDKEIDDYKSQGVKTSRKHIETARFDLIAFKNSMATSKVFEEQVKKLGTATFDADGQDLYRQIVTKHTWLMHASDGGDKEEEMEEDESSPMSNQGAQSSKQSWANRLPPSLAWSKNVTPVKTPTTSLSKSPAKSPGSSSSASDTSPAKDLEKQRKEELERKLHLEEQKKQEKKKKKKLAF